MVDIVSLESKLAFNDPIFWFDHIPVNDIKLQQLLIASVIDESRNKGYIVSNGIK